MARCLIIACGCRGRELARALGDRGHAVRGTTRNQDSARLIEAAGAESFVADPDRVATLMPALAHVAVLCLLLGCARGEPEDLEALHGSRLEMLLARLVDTTVRGLVYESRGSVPVGTLAAGSDRVSRACERSRLPFVLLDASPDNPEEWLSSALAAVQGLIS